MTKTLVEYLRSFEVEIEGKKSTVYVVVNERIKLYGEPIRVLIEWEDGPSIDIKTTFEDEEE